MNLNANALHIPLSDKSVHTCVTSPPYWGLRDYGVAGQLGAEHTPSAYIQAIVSAMREARRVLRDDGTLWLNLGDCYSIDGKRGGRGGGNNYTSLLGGILRNKRSGVPSKNLLGIPWRVAFALQDDGWVLRSDIIWNKPNGMPESVEDRPTRSHEYIFLFSKLSHYYYDYEAIKEPAKYVGTTGQNQTGFKDPAQYAGKHARTDKQRGHVRRHAGFNERWDKMSKAEQMSMRTNKRSVWTVSTSTYTGAHFATFPPNLITPCILAGAPEGGIALDPFGGSGTTVATARSLGRIGIGLELNHTYIAMAQDRIKQSTIWEPASCITNE